MKYDGNRESIWNDGPVSGQLKERLTEFTGINQNN